MRESHLGVVLGLHRSRYERHVLTNALDLGVRSIDTSFNYHAFAAHTTLAAIGSDILPHFTVSTKVGFFPGASHAEHSLAPDRLRSALAQTNRDLGRVPDLVFLHNPERSLQDASTCARDALAEACAALDDATAEGLCRSWGIASWNPRPLTTLIDNTTPKPSVLMIRAGLLVGINTLDAAESLAAQWDLGIDSLWGMSPFGGNAEDEVWNRVDPRIFLRGPTGELSRPQAAFRTAYFLPRVGTVVVGSDNPAHLRELLDVRRCEVDSQTVSHYRNLLIDRAPRHSA